MNIEAERSRSRGPLLTPLADIIFLLLMFFMLSSTFTKFATLELSARQDDVVTANEASDQEATGSAGAIAGIIIDLNRRRGLTVNGVSYSTEDRVNALNRLHAKGARSAILTTDGETNVQELISTLELARQSKVSTITIAR